MRRFSIGSLIIFAVICGGTGTLILGLRKFANIYINLYWRDYRGTTPSDALSTGHGTYIAQVIVHNGGLVPGTFYPSTKTAITEVETKKVEIKSNIKLLCTSQPNALKWEYVNVQQLDPSTLQKCVIGGFEDGSAVYIGKVFHEGQWKIGKVFPPTSKHKGLRVWWNNGDGYFPTDFQILMAA